MMIQSYSYHNHTNFSDGKNSLEEMVKQAKKIGFTEMGITDHLIVHKNMGQSLSQPYIQKRPKAYVYNSEFKPLIAKFQKHCEEIRKISQQENIKLYVGFEVDFFTYNGWLEELKDFMKNLDYDYLISGNHMLFDEACENMFDLNDLTKIYPDMNDYSAYMIRHFKTMKQAVESRMFKFLAHLDYARKLGEEICGAEMYKTEKTAVINALKKCCVGTEISTKGLRKIDDFYPCDWILSELKEQNIPIVISDDAHCVAELGVDFDKAEKALALHKIANRIKF